MNIHDVHNKYKGKCAILGNGPSLPSSLALWRQDEVVIGVNRSWKLHPSFWHVAVDQVHMREFGTLWDAPMVFLKDYQHERAIVLTNNPFPATFPLGRYVNYAGILALQVAIWMGYEEIYLYGYDMIDGEGKFYPLDGTTNNYARQRKYCKHIATQHPDREIYCRNSNSALINLFPFKGRENDSRITCS